MADDGRLHVVIDCDDSDLRDALKDLDRSFDSTTEEAERLGGSIDGLRGKIAGVFSAAAVTSFLEKVYETRSYFQDIESSMKVFLGNSEKAAEFTKELKDYAYYNMFEFSDLAEASQQLIAYGNATEDVIGIIDKLSNIATATKVPLKEMVGLYNRAKNLGRIDSDGLASWAAKGLVLNDVLRDMGVQVDGMSVSFDQLNLALDKVTGEGGMFHGLMDEMMPNLSSSWGQLQDEITSMFDEIGEAIQDPMHDAIDLASTLVSHYKEIAAVVLSVAGAYGTYRASVMLVSAAEKIHGALISLKSARLAIAKAAMTAAAAANETMSRSELKAAIRTGTLKGAIDALNGALMKNPAVLVTAALAGLTYGMYRLVTAEKAAEKAQRLHSEAMSEMDERYSSAKESAEGYISTIQDSEATAGQRTLAYDRLSEIVPELTALYGKEELAVMSLAEAYRGLQRAQDIQKEKELERAWQDASEEVRRYKEAMDVFAEKGMQYPYLRAKEAFEQAEEASKLAFDAYVKKSRENAVAYVPDQNESQAEEAKRNKAYWESVKKESQRALDAMSDEELKTKEAAELKRRIVEANKKIAGYSTGADKGTTNRDSAQYTKTVETFRRDAADAAVNAIEDAGAREIAALRLKHRREMEELYSHKSEVEEAARRTGEALQDGWFEKYVSDVGERQTREMRSAFEKNGLKALPRIVPPKKDGLVGFGSDGADSAKTIKELAAQYSLIFADADSLSRDQLKKAIALTTEEIKKAKPGTQEYVELLGRLRSQLETQTGNNGWGFSKIIDGLKSLPYAVERYNSALSANDEGKASEAEGEIQAYVQAVRDGMSQVSSAFSEVGGALEKFDGTLGHIGGLLSGLASNTDNIVTAFTSKNKGDIIASGISSAVSFVSMIGDQMDENRRIEEEWNAVIRQTAHELDMLNLDSLDYSQRNLFGVENPYKRAIDGARQYGEAMGTLNSRLGELADGQVQVGTKKVSNWKNVGKGVAAGAGVGAAVGTAVGGWAAGIGTVIGTAIGSVVGGLGALFGGKKKVAVYESLLDHYGSLLDTSEGAGPFDLNPKIIADYKKLDDATKQLVDNWDEIKKKAEEAEQQMRDNFSDLAGDIGDQLSDSLVDAFRNRALDTAIDDFHGKMTTTIEDIVSQLIFSSVFGDMFDELESRFVGSFGDGGDQSITDDLIWFDKVYRGNLEKYKDAMDQAKEELERSGYDVWSADGRTGTSRSGITASQDSVDELNGRATAIQGYTYNIQENTAALVRHSASMLEHLSGIRDNTARLESIERIARDIRDHGVKAL